MIINEIMTTHEEQLNNGATVTFTDVNVTVFAKDPNEEWISTEDCYVIQKYTEHLANQNHSNDVTISVTEAKEVIENSAL